MSIVRRFKISIITGVWKGDDKKVYDEVCEILNNLKEDKLFEYSYNDSVLFKFGIFTGKFMYLNPLKRIKFNLSEDNKTDLVDNMCLPYIREKYHL